MQSHIRRVYLRLFIIHHRHFWQTVLYVCIEYCIYVSVYDVSAQNAHYYYYLVRATAVTRGWDGTEMRVSTES